MKDTIFINVKSVGVSVGMFNVVMQIDVDEPNEFERDIIADNVYRLADGAVHDCDGDDWECSISFAECGKTFQTMGSPDELPNVSYVTNIMDGHCGKYNLGELARWWVISVLNGYKGA